MAGPLIVGGGVKGRQVRKNKRKKNGICRPGKKISILLKLTYRIIHIQVYTLSVDKVLVF